MQPEADTPPPKRPSRWRRLFPFGRNEAGGEPSASPAPAPRPRASVGRPVEIVGWNAFDWLAPWVAVDRTTSAALDAELRRELCSRHDLSGQPLAAVGRRTDRDSVLFRWRDGSERAVIVHLTNSAECDPNWPSYEVVSTRDAFLRRMAIDHGSHLDREAEDGDRGAGWDERASIGGGSG